MIKYKKSIIEKVLKHDLQSGNFNIAKPAAKRTSGGGSKTLTSAFDTEDLYELTDLGQQFVHYAMTELTLRIAYTYKPGTSEDAAL